MISIKSKINTFVSSKIEIYNEKNYKLLSNEIPQFLYDTMDTDTDPL